MRRQSSDPPPAPDAARRDFGRRSIALALALSGMSGEAAAPAERLQRPIPKSGEQLPVIGLGSWRTLDVADLPAERPAAKETLRSFVQAGGRVIDTSPMYGSAESVIGELAGELGIADRLFHATKVWTTGRQAGIEQMENSMRRLRTSRIDLMQVHNLSDAAVYLPVLREWKASGRIRYLGVTHYHEGAHAELERWVREGDLDFVQVNYSLAEPEAERRLLPAARDHRTAVLVNRPFAEGALFVRVKETAVPAWAGELGCASWAQLFLKWILGHPAVTCAVPATRNPRHLADNMAAGSGRMPDARERARIAALVRGG